MVRSYIVIVIDRQQILDRIRMSGLKDTGVERDI